MAGYTNDYLPESENQYKILHNTLGCHNCIYATKEHLNKRPCCRNGYATDPADGSCVNRKTNHNQED